MNGKGDKRRPGDDEAYRRNWDRIFKDSVERNEKEEEGALLPSVATQKAS